MPGRERFERDLTRARGACLPSPRIGRGVKKSELLGHCDRDRLQRLPQDDAFLRAAETVGLIANYGEVSRAQPTSSSMGSLKPNQWEVQS